jgi:hypothetical protein
VYFSLQEGDRIGLMRKSNGALHYYINGQDQGVAATRTPIPAWGVVDLYGMAVKVTILDHTDPEFSEERACGMLQTNRANELLRQFNTLTLSNSDEGMLNGLTAK